MAVLLEGQRADGRLNGILEPAFKVLRHRLPLDGYRQPLAVVAAGLEQNVLHFCGSGAVNVLVQTLAALPT